MGYPILILDRVPPLILTWDGVPQSWPVMGSPPVQTWDAVSPCPDLGWGTHPHQSDGVPPVEVWTDKLKTVPSPILRMRAVKMIKSIYLDEGNFFKNLNGSSELVCVDRERSAFCFLPSASEGWGKALLQLVSSMGGGCLILPQRRLPHPSQLVGIPPSQVRMGDPLGWGTSPSRSGARTGWGYPQLEQQSVYFLHSGRYASCIYAGGLSCFALFLFSGHICRTSR